MKILILLSIYDFMMWNKFGHFMALGNNFPPAVPSSQPHLPISHLPHPPPSPISPSRTHPPSSTSIPFSNHSFRPLVTLFTARSSPFSPSPSSPSPPFHPSPPLPLFTPRHSSPLHPSLLLTPPTLSYPSPFSSQSYLIITYRKYSESKNQTVFQWNVCNYYFVCFQFQNFSQNTASSRFMT